MVRLCWTQVLVEGWWYPCERSNYGCGGKELTYQGFSSASLPRNDNPIYKNALNPDHSTRIQKADASNIWNPASQGWKLCVSTLQWLENSEGRKEWQWGSFSQSWGKRLRWQYIFLGFVSLEQLWTTNLYDLIQARRVGQQVMTACFMAACESECMCVLHVHAHVQAHGSRHEVGMRGLVSGLECKGHIWNWGSPV